MAKGQQRSAKEKKKPKQDKAKSTHAPSAYKAEMSGKPVTTMPTAPRKG